MQLFRAFGQCYLDSKLINLWVELPWGLTNSSWACGVFFLSINMCIFSSSKYQCSDGFIHLFLSLHGGCWRLFLIYSSLLGINISRLCPQTPSATVRHLSLMSQAFPVRLSQILFLSVTTTKCRAMIQSFGFSSSNLRIHGK